MYIIGINISICKVYYNMMKFVNIFIEISIHGFYSKYDIIIL